MHDLDGPTPKPPSTWGNTPGPGCHNVHYRTPAYPASASGEAIPDYVAEELSLVITEPTHPDHENHDKGDHCDDYPPNVSFRAHLNLQALL